MLDQLARAAAMNAAIDAAEDAEARWLCGGIVRAGDWTLLDFEHDDEARKHEYTARHVLTGEQRRFEISPYSHASVTEPAELLFRLWVAAGLPAHEPLQKHTLASLRAALMAKAAERVAAVLGRGVRRMDVVDDADLNAAHQLLTVEVAA